MIARLVPFHGVHADADAHFQNGFSGVLVEAHRVLQKRTVEIGVNLEAMLFGFLEKRMGIRRLGAVRYAARKRAPEFANGLPEGLRFDCVRCLNCFGYHAASLSFHSTVQEKGSCWIPVSKSKRPCFSTPYSGRNEHGRSARVMVAGAFMVI